ncbi:MAG: hypothetical protein AB1776_06695 [Bacillota bacterium]
MVAVGNLAGLWTEVPEDGDPEEVKRGLRRVFGPRWEAALVARDALPLFPFWNGYLGIAALRPRPEVAVARLKTLLAGETIYDVILG